LVARERHGGGQAPHALRDDEEAQVPVTGFWSGLVGGFTGLVGTGAPVTAPKVSGRPKKPAKPTKRTEKKAKGGDCGESSWVVQRKLDRRLSTRVRRHERLPLAA
jgi:hypothetical protein